MMVVGQILTGRGVGLCSARFIGRLVCAALVYIAISPIASSEVGVARSAAAPSDDNQVITLNPRWTIDNESEESVILGVVTDVEFDDAGNTYLLDYQLSHVVVFDRNGNYAGEIGGPGEGPGEVTRPEDLIIIETGQIGLLKKHPGSVVFIEPNGVPAGRFTPGDLQLTGEGYSIATACYSTKGAIVLGVLNIVSDRDQYTQKRNYFLRRYDGSGARLAEYYSKSYSWDFKAFHMKEIDTDLPWERVAVYPDGTVVIAPERYGYRLEIYDANASLLATSTRDYNSYPRSPDYMKLVDEAFQIQLRNAPPGSSFEIEEYEADISDLQIVDGDIWVQSSRQRWEAKDGEFCYDIFGKSGQFQRTVSLRCDGNPRTDKLFFGPDGIVVKIHQFHDLSLLGLVGDGAPEELAMTVSGYSRH